MSLWSVVLTPVLYVYAPLHITNSSKSKYSAIGLSLQFPKFTVEVCFRLDYLLKVVGYVMVELCNYELTGYFVVNLPNILTLSRIPFLFFVVGLLYVPFEGAQTLAFALFVIGSVTDWLDGFLARRYGIVSKFGKLMDALTDKVFIVGTCVAFLAAGILPQWTVVLVLLIISREFFVTGLRLVAASQGCVIAAEKAGKLKTFMQMLSLGTLLATQALATDFPNGLSAIFLKDVHTIGLCLFGLATLITLYSGFGYLVRYGYLLRDPDQSG